MNHFMNGFADELIKLGQGPEMTFKPSEGMQIPSKAERAVPPTGQPAVRPKPPTGDALLKRRDALFAMRRKRPQPKPPTGDALLKRRDALFDMRRKMRADNKLLAKRDALFDMRRKLRQPKAVAQKTGK